MSHCIPHECHVPVNDKCTEKWAHYTYQHAYDKSSYHEIVLEWSDKKLRRHGYDVPTDARQTFRHEDHKVQ